MTCRFWRLVLFMELAIAGLFAVLLSVLGGAPVSRAIGAGMAAILVLHVVFVAVPMAVGLKLSRVGWHPVDILYCTRALITEVLQFALATVRMSFPPRFQPCDVAAPAAGAPARPVLLVHGILCNCAIWRRLYQRLRSAGFAPIRTVNLEPFGGDIDAGAANVQSKISDMHRESRGAPVAIVAHSMGGLVARSALRVLSPDVVSRVITVATPHHGSALARLLPLPAARQMQLRSAWLQKLNAAQETRFPVPVLSIYSREDGLVAPARSAALQGAEAVEMRGIGHFGLLSSPAVIERILSELTRS
jgi:pimeloyl-ACP methyl ester carboxylesterase